MTKKKQTTQETIQGCISLILLLGCGWFAISSGLLGGIIDGVESDREQRAVWTAEAVNMSPIQRLVADKLKRKDEVEITVHELVPSISITFLMTGSVWGAGRDMIDLSCLMRDSGLVPNYVHIFVAKTKLTDQFGNITIESGVTAQLQPETINQLNCENQSAIDISKITGSYRVHSALR